MADADVTIARIRQLVKMKDPTSAEKVEEALSRNAGKEGPMLERMAKHYDVKIEDIPIPPAGGEPAATEPSAPAAAAPAKKAPAKAPAKAAGKKLAPGGKAVKKVPAPKKADGTPRPSPPPSVHGSQPPSVPPSPTAAGKAALPARRLSAMPDEAGLSQESAAVTSPVVAEPKEVLLAEAEAAEARVRRAPTTTQLQVLEFCRRHAPGFVPQCEAFLVAAQREPNKDQLEWQLYRLMARRFGMPPAPGGPQADGAGDPGWLQVLRQTAAAFGAGEHLVDSFVFEHGTGGVAADVKGQFGQGKPPRPLDAAGVLHGEAAGGKEKEEEAEAAVTFELLATLFPDMLLHALADDAQRRAFVAMRLSRFLSFHLALADAKARRRDEDAVRANNGGLLPHEVQLRAIQAAGAPPGGAAAGVSVPVIPTTYPEPGSYGLRLQMAADDAERRAAAAAAAVLRRYDGHGSAAPLGDVLLRFYGPALQKAAVTSVARGALYAPEEAQQLHGGEDELAAAAAHAVGSLGTAKQLDAACRTWAAGRSRLATPPFGVPSPLAPVQLAAPKPPAGPGASPQFYARPAAGRADACCGADAPGVEADADRLAVVEAAGQAATPGYGRPLSRDSAAQTDDDAAFYSVEARRRADAAATRRVARAEAGIVDSDYEDATDRRGSLGNPGRILVVGRGSHETGSGSSRFADPVVARSAAAFGLVSPTSRGAAGPRDAPCRCAELEEQLQAATERVHELRRMLKQQSAMAAAEQLGSAARSPSGPRGSLAGSTFGASPAGARSLRPQTPAFAEHESDAAAIAQMVDERDYGGTDLLPAGPCAQCQPLRSEVKRLTGRLHTIRMQQAPGPVAAAPPPMVQLTPQQAAREALMAASGRTLRGDASGYPGRASALAPSRTPSRQGDHHTPQGTPSRVKADTGHFAGTAISTATLPLYPASNQALQGLEPMSDNEILDML